MGHKKPYWRGSSIKEYIADQMKDPEFRLAFADARAKQMERAFAGAIRSARRRLGLSQVILAKRVKTTQAVISRIENSATSYLPSVEVLNRIAMALGAHLEIAFVAEERKAA